MFGLAVDERTRNDLYECWSDLTTNRSDRIPNNRCFMIYEGWGKLLHQFELNWSPNATPDFFIPKANIAGIEMTPDAGHAVSVHILRPVGS